MWAYIVFARTFLLHLLHTEKTQKKITPFLNEKTQKNPRKEYLLLLRFLVFASTIDSNLRITSRCDPNTQESCTSLQQED